VIATGIEAGHGRRNYLIDLNSGDSKPMTPEGVVGISLSPDGSSVAVHGPDGKLGIWPLDSNSGGDGIRIIPGLDPQYVVAGWSPDGKSVYVASTHPEQKAKVVKVDTATGKTEPWKTFGAGVGAGVTETGAPEFSSDGSAYAYVYVQNLSNAYVVTGLK
jgi:DNA-binding beta-propeller fold protein YncE